MNFIEQKLFNIKTPILVPPDFELTDVKKEGWIEYVNPQTGKKEWDEVIFTHDQRKVTLEQFWKYLENDSVAVMLFSLSNKLFLQKRSVTKRWEPGKLDLYSVVGQKRAWLDGDRFRQEDPQDAIRREMSEEMGVDSQELSNYKLEKIGTHFNPSTKEHQIIFACQVLISLDALNQNVKQGLTEEVEEWFEQGYEQTMQEYFGDQVDKYAGGAEMRPINFISNPEIKKNLDNFYKSLPRLAKF